MQRSLLNTLAIILAVPLSAYAKEDVKEYHFDSYLTYARENNGYFDTNNWRASLQYYWNPISYASDYPNKEAIFVNRLGSVGIQYRGAQGDNDYEKMLTTAIDTNFTYAAKDFNHVFQFNYSWENITNDYTDMNFLGDNRFLETFTSELEAHQLNFAYDYYLLDNWTLGASFEVGFFDDSYIKDTTYTYGMNSKYLLSVGDDNWLSLTALYVYVDKGENFTYNSLHYIEAGAEYYFNVQTSLKLAGGANIQNVSDYYFSRTITTEFIHVSVYHYFVDQFAVYTGFSYLFNGSGDAQSYQVGVNYRF